MDIIFKRSPTTANTALVLEFPVKGTKFLVKNLTDGNVYVALKKLNDIEADSSESVKGECVLIPENTAQLVVCRELPYVEGTNIVTVIPEATSEKGVEVQCLKW